MTEQKSFYPHELSRQGLRPEDFRYRIEAIWGHVVDEIYTNDLDEVEKNEAYFLEGQYDVRILDDNVVIRYVTPDGRDPWPTFRPGQA